MDLVFDIGNTLQKAAIFSNDGNLIVVFKEKNLTEEFLDKIIEDYSVGRAIISSVSTENPKISEWLKTKVELVEMNSETKLPIVLKYSTSGTLGTDRIANAVGANAIFPNSNVLSVMAGTCLVTDFVNDRNEYLGGSIAPGLKMRFGALHSFTARLPLVKPSEIDFLTGDSTENSILSGVINGISSEIDGIIDHYTSICPDLKVILSGGDSEFLQNYIKKRIFAAQNPILLGLHKILQFNVSEN